MTATQDTLVLRALQRPQDYAELVLGESSEPSSKMRAYSVSVGSGVQIREGYSVVAGVAVYPIAAAVPDLWEQLNEAKCEIARLRDEVEALKTASNTSIVVQDSIEVDFNQAKAEIAELFDARGHLAYSDLMRELGFDIDVVVAACDELIEEGRIRECSEAQ